MKKLLWALGILALLFVLGWFFLGSVLNSLIVYGVEKYGSRATGTEVRLEKADVSVFKGKGVLNGLSVDNPEGFKEVKAFSVARASIDMAPASILSDHVLVNDLSVHGARIYVQQKGKSSNLQVLLDNIQEGAASSDSSSAEDKPEKGAGKGQKKEKSGLKLEIKKISILETRVQIDAPNRSAKATLPAIRLKNIGSAQNGVPPEEISREIMRALMNELNRALLGSLLDLDPEALSGMGKSLEKEFKKDGKINVQKKLKELKGLFKKQ